MADARRSIPELERIRREAAAPRKERLRIVISSDASRPVRTITLPRGLPRAVTIIALLLIATTGVLIAGSWHMNGSLRKLDDRVRSMVEAADTLALHPLPGATEASAELPAGAAVHRPSGDKAHVVLHLVNTGEEVDVKLDLASGEVEASSYRALRRLMLYRISQRTHTKIEVVSGFRAPMFSLATLSYHTRGMAADIRIPGMTPLMVRDLARSMGVKGIGYYPVSQFVHVDVRDDKQEWTDFGENRFDAEGGEHDPSRGNAEPATE